MTIYRNPPSLPAAGDVLWTLETEPARLVRVLHVERMRAWVQPIASVLERSTPIEVAVSSLQVQVGSDGSPTQPTRVRESDDRPDTHIAYPSGIESARFGGVLDAVMARPAVMDADSQRWELHAPSCPFAQLEGPRMLCAWGSRIGEAFMMEGSCPHSAGMRRGTDGKVLSGCRKAGIAP